MEALLSVLTVLPFDLSVARFHAVVWAELRARGVTVGTHDLLIAATALPSRRQASQIRARSPSRGLMDELPLGQDVGAPNRIAERLHVHEVHGPAEPPLQLLFHVPQVEEAPGGTRLELDQHVDVARRGEVVAEHGTEEPEPADHPPLAEVLQQCGSRPIRSSGRVSPVAASREGPWSGASESPGVDGAGTGRPSRRALRILGLVVTGDALPGGFSWPQASVRFTSSPR